MSEFKDPTPEEAQKFMEEQQAASSSSFKDPTPEEAEKFMAQASKGKNIDTDIDFTNLARMFAEGYTSGFGGEAIGGVRAALDTSEEDLYNLYRKKAQEEEEEIIEAFKKQHPIPAVATEFAGAVASPVNKLIAPLMASKGILGALKGGLASGLITGAGTSKHTIEQPKEYIEDIIGTGVTGAALSPAISALGGVATKQIPKALKSIEESSELGKNLITAFRESSKGKGFILKESQERLQKQEEEIAKQFEKQMYGEKGPIQKTQKEMEEFFNAATKSGAKIDAFENAPLKQEISNLIDKLEQNQLLKEVPEINVPFSSEMPIQVLPISMQLKKLLQRGEDVGQVLGSSTETKIFTDNIQKLLNKEMSPSDAYTFARWLNGDNIPGWIQLKSSMFKKLVNDSPELIKELKDAAKASAKNVLGEKSLDVFTKFKDVRAGTVDTILNRGKPSDVSDIWQSEYAKSEIKNKLYDDFRDIINKLQDPSSIGDESRNTIRVLQTRIDELNKKYPDLNLDIKDFIDRLKDVAAQRTVRNKMITAHGSTASSKDIISKLVDWTGYGGAILTGNVIGRPINAVREVFSNQLVKAPNATLMPIADELSKTKGLEHVGGALQQSLDNGSYAAKNAALFMILQNPQASSIAKGILGAE